MATKKDYLSYFSSLVKDGVIKRSDIERAYFQATGEDLSGISDKRKDFFHQVEVFVFNLLGFFGALVLFLGTYGFIFDSWVSWGSFIKVLSTLGVGLFLLILSLFGFYFKKLVKFSNLLLLISGFLLPIGISVLLLESGIFIDSSLWEALVYLILGLLFLFAYFQTLRNIILTLVIFYFTISYYLLMSILIKSMVLDNINFSQNYLILVLFSIGIFYFVLSNLFNNTIRNSLVPYLKFISYFFILLFVVYLPYFSSDYLLQFMITQLVLFLLGFYFSAKIGSYLFLFLNTCFLIFSFLGLYPLFTSRLSIEIPTWGFWLGSGAVFGVAILTGFQIFLMRKPLL